MNVFPNKHTLSSAFSFFPSYDCISTHHPTLTLQKKKMALRLDAPAPMGLSSAAALEGPSAAPPGFSHADLGQTLTNPLPFGVAGSIDPMRNMGYQSHEPVTQEFFFDLSVFEQPEDIPVKGEAVWVVRNRKFGKVIQDVQIIVGLAYLQKILHADSFRPPAERLFDTKYKFRKVFNFLGKVDSISKQTHRARNVSADRAWINVLVYGPCEVAFNYWVKNDHNECAAYTKGLTLFWLYKHVPREKKDADKLLSHEKSAPTKYQKFDDDTGVVMEEDSDGEEEEEDNKHGGDDLDLNQEQEQKLISRMWTHHANTLEDVFKTTKTSEYKLIIDGMMNHKAVNDKDLAHAVHSTIQSVYRLHPDVLKNAMKGVDILQMRAGLKPIFSHLYGDSHAAKDIDADDDEDRQFNTWLHQSGAASGANASLEPEVKTKSHFTRPVFADTQTMEFSDSVWPPVEEQSILDMDLNSLENGAFFRPSVIGKRRQPDTDDDNDTSPPNFKLQIIPYVSRNGKPPPFHTYINAKYRLVGDYERVGISNFIYKSAATPDSATNMRNWIFPSERSVKVNVNRLPQFELLLVR